MSNLVPVDVDALRTLLIAVEGFWMDHRFAWDTEPHKRDMAAVDEARKALLRDRLP